MRGHVGVGETLAEAETIYLNPIVLGELRAGFLRESRRQRNEDQLERVCETPRVHLAPIDGQTSNRYAVILEFLRKAGTPIGTNDLWIASTAMQLGLTVVTTDTDFGRVSQMLTRCYDA